MADSSTHATSLYPLDKNRKLLSGMSMLQLVQQGLLIGWPISERRDAQGTVYKLFRIFSDDGDFIDVEYVVIFVFCTCDSFVHACVRLSVALHAGTKSTTHSNPPDSSQLPANMPLLVRKQTNKEI